MGLRLEAELLQAVEGSDVQLVADLLAVGADANAGLFSNEKTALSIAVRNANEEIVDLLLAHGCGCCLRERDPESPLEIAKPPPARRLTKHLCKFLGLHVAISVVRFVLRNVAFAIGIGAFRDALLLITGHYLFYAYFTATSALHAPDTMWQRYRDWRTHVDTFWRIGVSHQLSIMITGRLSGDYSYVGTFYPAFRYPGYLKDLAFAFPIRLALDTIVAITNARKLAVRAGVLTAHKWAGPIPKDVDSETWDSPAKLLMQSIFEPCSITKRRATILKLLKADMLASRPYSDSEVANVLRDLAITQCWDDVLEYLFEEGVRADTETLLSWDESKKFTWPSPVEALLYAFPSMDTSLLPRQEFKGASVRNTVLNCAGFGCNCTFANLLCSSWTFHQLAGANSSESDHSLCEKMMDLLAANGANPATDDRSNLVSRLVALKDPYCSTRVIEHLLKMLQPRVDLADYLDETGRADYARSPTLHEVVRSIHPNLEQISLLLKYGASPEAENSEGRTALFVAAYMNEPTEAMDLLLVHGANPNNGGTKGVPPLLRALDDASLPKFAFLLSRGADPNAIWHGKSILTIVLERVSDNLVVLKKAVVECLLDRYHASVYDPQTQTSPPLLAAIALYNGVGYRENILSLLIDAIPEEVLQAQLDLALKFACGKIRLFETESANLFTLFYLLKRGANPLATLGASLSDTMLHVICSSDNYGDGMSEYKEDMRALLRQGVLDVNFAGCGGKYPLHHAVERRHRDFVLLLLKHGTVADVKDARGQTPLHHLCSCKPPAHDIANTTPDAADSLEDDSFYEGLRGDAAIAHTLRRIRLHISQSLAREEILQALLEDGADPLEPDTVGQNAIMKACIAGDCVALSNLLYSIMKVHEEARDALAAAARSLSLVEGLSGKTALHMAAADGHVSAMRLLLDPARILLPEQNPWRSEAASSRFAAVDEDDSDSGDSASRDKMNREDIAGRKSKLRMAEQMEELARVSTTMASYVPGNMTLIHMSAPGSVSLSTGRRCRRTEEYISLPNVTASGWDSSVRPLTSAPHAFLAHLTDDIGNTPMHYAAEGGHLEAVELLLELTDAKSRSSRAFPKNKRGKTPLCLALQNNYFDIHSILVARQTE